MNTRRNLKFVFATVLAGTLLLAPVWADDDGSINTNEDDLFGSSDGVIDADEDSLFGSEDDLFAEDSLIEEAIESAVDLSSALLVSETVRIGGNYNFSVGGTWGWDDPAGIIENFTDPVSMSMDTTLSSRLFFDARPDDGFRVYGKMTAEFPFQTQPDGEDMDTDADRVLQDVFHVEELFSDININEQVFLRVGKQNMNWGVGYFYSPADLLSIAEIDPEDPEAEREGPVGIKANIPIWINNLYFYLLPASVADPEPLDMGIATRGELVLGAGEIGGGLIYQRDIAPAGMVTASYSVRDFDLFGEGVVSYGSNRTFVREIPGPPFLEAYTKTDEFLFSGTAGFTYSYSPSESDSTLMLIGQYLFNGEGYTDTQFIMDNQAGIGALIGADEIETRDLQNIGTHYAAVNASVSDLFGSDINLSVFYMQSFTDMSAMITPSLSRTFFDEIDVSLQVPVMLGETGAELAPFGDYLSASLTVSLGGGRF